MPILASPDIPVSALKACQHSAHATLIQCCKSTPLGIQTAIVFAMINPPELYRPIYSGKVAAGLSRFPSPAQDYEQEELDLNKHLIKNPPATFYYNVGADYDSMIDVGILPKALLIVDRSINPKSSHIVVAVVNGAEVVKRLYKWRGVIELRSENKEMNYPPVVFKDGDELIIEGVVTSNVNKF